MELADHWRVKEESEILGQARPGNQTNDGTSDRKWATQESGEKTLFDIDFCWVTLP